MPLAEFCIADEPGFRPEDNEYFVAAQLAGRVGLQPPRLGAQDWGSGTLRVDCVNNPEFWLEYTADTGMVRGRVPTELYERQEAEAGGFRKPFVLKIIERDGRKTARITHAGCAAFWLEIGL